MSKKMNVFVGLMACLIITFSATGGFVQASSFSELVNGNQQVRSKTSNDTRASYGNEFVGIWRGGKVSVDISRNKDLFIIDARTNGFIYGKYVGQLTSAGLKANFGIAGKQFLIYSPAEDTLDFGGEILKRKQQIIKEVVNVPPVIVISKNACPFEGCQLGKWTAKQPVVAYVSVDGFPKKSIRAGELIIAMYGEIRATPLKAIVTSTYKTDEDQGITVGDTIYVLHPIGEGAVAVLKNGKVIDGSLDLTFRYEEPMDSQRHNWVWWVQVRFGDGTTGWVKDPRGDQFDGMDYLG